MGDPTTPPPEALDAAAVRGTFDRTRAFTVGLEEEVLLLDPATHAPAAVADQVVRAAADERIKQELPACQVELVTRPHAGVGGAVDELAEARRALLRATGGAVAVIAGAVHPAVAAAGSLTASPRHRAIEQAFGEVARRQLVSSLQVHVALGDADRALAVYNALRGHLPALAALAAAAPFHEGRDTGLASVRPVVAGQLPRQGVPPAIASWEALVDDLRWGSACGAVPEPRWWWWELRPHVVHGTLEVRVPDVQPTVAGGAAVADVVHALVRHLARRHDDGEPLGSPETWRIAENRWCALRDGVHGALADLVTGEVTPTRVHLHSLIDRIEEHAPEGLEPARRLVEGNAADELRRVGLRRATAWLVDAFAP